MNLKRKKNVIFCAIALTLLSVFLNFYFKLDESRIGANFFCIGVPLGNNQSQCVGYPYVYLHIDPIGESFVTNYYIGNISFTYDDSVFSTKSEKTKREDGTERATINLTHKDGGYGLFMNLNMDDIGGACIDFPKGYEVGEFVVDGVTVFKAKLIDQKQANGNWPLGNIYLVQKDKYGSWNCPNVAGIESKTNGATWIEYDLSKYKINSPEYVNAERQLDNIVSTIKGLW